MGKGRGSTRGECKAAQDGSKKLKSGGSPGAGRSALSCEKRGATDSQQ